MKWWKVAKATALTLAPLAVLVAVLEVRLASGMTSWDIRLTLALGLTVGMWMVHAVLLYSPRAEPPTPKDEGPTDPLSALLGGLAGRGGAIPVFQVGSGERCADCGEIHDGEPMVVVPLPDGSCVVSHKDRDSSNGHCDWAAHAEDVGQAQAAAHLHEEFQCARNRQRS